MPLILARGWEPWPLGLAPCLVPDCASIAEFMHKGGYCREHTMQLGGLLLVGEERPTTLAMSTRAAIEATVRLQILGDVSAVLIDAIEAGEHDVATITSLGIRIQNAISRRNRT